VSWSLQPAFALYAARACPSSRVLPDNNEQRKTLPTLEDANSIPVTLANVMETSDNAEIDHKTAALMMYALQMASMNLKRTSLEPALPTQGSD
jgi:hypothetical protein